MFYVTYRRAARIDSMMIEAISERGAANFLSVAEPREGAYSNGLFAGRSGHASGRSVRLLLDAVSARLDRRFTQHEANLVYSGHSGALNESVSDVFGIQVKQQALSQTVEQADWLIGADIVGSELKPALRSMKEPGTANPHDD